MTARRNPPKRIYGEIEGEGSIKDIAPQFRGKVEIEVNERQDDGTYKTVEKYSDSNLIVYNAPLIMGYCLAGASYPTYTIGGVQWGTGGHVSGDTSTPVPPSSTDTALENLILETSIASYSVGQTYVQFESEMDISTGNGNVFTEAGLVISGVAKLMFARKTFPGITKTANRTLTLRWIISFLQGSSGSDCQGVAVFGQLSQLPEYSYTVPSSPPSTTDITVPLTWTPGLNRFWVFRNGKRVFDGEAFDENYPTGITNINPPLVMGEKWVFSVVQ